MNYGELNFVQPCPRQLMKEKELRSIMMKNVRAASANWVARAREQRNENDAEVSQRMNI